MELNIKLIQETFALIQPRAEELANRFYSRLFHDYPLAQELFKSLNLNTQKRLLVASLMQVVHNLENPEFLGEYLGKMGERHHAFGITDEHFEWIGQTLLKTLIDMLGPAWTPEIHHQWTLALDMTAALMREGVSRVNTKVVQLPKAQGQGILKKVS